jgi:translation initiation factor IF-1
MDREGEGLRGTVIEQLPQALYRVRLDSGHVITAHGTGDIRRNFVRILVGDRAGVAVGRHARPDCREAVGRAGSLGAEAITRRRLRAGRHHGAAMDASERRPCQRLGEREL